MEKGVISETSIGSYGSGDPFTGGLTENIPSKTTVEQEDVTKYQDKVEEPAPKGDVGYLLYNMLKSERADLLDDLEIGEDTDLPTTISKIAEALDAKSEAKAQKILKEKGWTDERLKYAQMLENGLSPEDQTELAKLNAYSKVEVNLDDKTSVDNCIHIIQEMYKDKLSGTVLRKALENIDPESEDFPQEAKEAIEHWKVRRNQLVDSKLKERDENDRQVAEFDQKIRDNVEKGEIYGIKLDKKDIKAYTDKIYTPTETVTVNENGKDVVRKVSLYEKNYNELLKDPAKMARLMMFIADGLDSKLAFEAGKATYAEQLRAKLSGQPIEETNHFNKATSLGTVRGGEIVLDQRSY